MKKFAAVFPFIFPFICFVGIGSFLLSSGCAGIIMDQMLDSMATFVERMDKLNKERREELRAKISTIEGEISKAEMVEKEVEEDAHVVNNDNGKMEVKIEKKKVMKKVYTVYFEDGREKTFTEIPDKPLLAGVYYYIKYNGLDEIIDIDEKAP